MGKFEWLAAKAWMARQKGLAGAGEVIDFILPPRCLISGAVVDTPGMTDPAVWSEIDFLGAPCCDCCGHPFSFAVSGKILCAECLDQRPVYERARAALAYRGLARDMVLRFKHADHLHAVQSFVPWMIRAGGPLLDEADILVPVPLHRGRLLKRRYNQAGLLAQALGKKTGRAVYIDGLRRLRATPSQGHMNRKDRARNVKSAFAADDKYDFSGKSVVIIDDVYTTGATTQECAKALLKAGAARVHVLTLARVVKNEIKDI